MLTFDISQLQHLLGTVLWPFLRIGACLMTAPLFGASHVPRRMRVLLSVAVTVVALPMLPTPPPIELLSGDGVFVTFQQVLIGATMGFVLQTMFEALALAGMLLANSMGLGFSFNIDPLHGVTTPSLGQFYTILGTLTFLALGGHLALIETLVASFRGLPIGGPGLGPDQYFALANLGGALFAGALRISLPGITALLVVNLAFGVSSRAAPSLNLFAIGFPMVLICGLAAVLLGLPTVQRGMVALLADSFVFLRALSGEP